MIDEKMLFYELGKAAGGGGSSDAPIIEPLVVTENGEYNADGVDGYSPIFVDVPQVELESIDITENGTYTAEDGKAFNEVVVDVKGGGGVDWINEITHANYMFSRNKFETAPDFDLLNVTATEYMFYNCDKLKSIPTTAQLHGTHTSCRSMFEYCYLLREIPEKLFENVKYSTNHEDVAQVFDNCYSLRKIPEAFYKAFENGRIAYQTSATILYHNHAYNCYALDEIVKLPTTKETDVITSNLFSDTLSKNYRLGRFTFATNADGTAKVVKWKSQYINLSSVGVMDWGYCKPSSYNIGLSDDNIAYDATTYAKVKNNPDWTATKNTTKNTDHAYCRYNHDSAVETINSLPDTSAYLATAGGTNTIRFKGAAGSGTDGGAINTLTEEEIAVATSKGWTVSFA